MLINNFSFLYLFLLITTFELNLRSITETPKLTFSEGLITETVSGEGYSISDTTLIISKSGSYILTGSCSECNIEVKKSTTDVILILNSLIISCSTTAPIILKKSSSVIIQLEGNSTITDLEDINNESTDENFEGASIKIKSGGNLIIEGTGILNIIGTSCKNGIKGGATSSITINSGNIIIKAANNGLSSDNSIIINDGNITIISENDGIKSEPDSDDTESKGEININGGNFIINSNGDGIQSKNILNITNGNFNITTLTGYNDNNFDSDTMSCKGLKVSIDENETIIPLIIISGGVYNLNTADDAIHSDGNITILKGIFNIYTGDDGIHSDKNITLGIENNTNDDLSIIINYSYEGIEGANITIYSGIYNVYSTDDGINAADGTSTDSSFWRPGQSNSNKGKYNINIYGGNIYVNAEGDGIDSNGNIYIYGGNLEIWGMKSGGDNEPLDHDGNLEIYNAIIFVGGTRGMKYLHNSINKIKQGYIYSTQSLNNNINIYVYDENKDVVYESKTPKNVNYIFYSSPNTNSKYSFGTNNSSNSINTYSNSTGSSNILQVNSVILMILLILLK